MKAECVAFQDSAVDPLEWTEHADAVTQWIDPDDPALDDWPLWPVQVAPSVDSIDQLEERSLTPPRGPIRPPEPSLPDVADWPHEPDRSTPPLEASANLRRLSSAEMSSTGTSSCSSSLQMASHSTLPDSSTSQVRTATISRFNQKANYLVDYSNHKMNCNNFQNIWNRRVRAFA